MKLVSGPRHAPIKSAFEVENLTVQLPAALNDFYIDEASKRKVSKSCLVRLILMGVEKEQAVAKYADPIIEASR